MLQWYDLAQSLDLDQALTQDLAKQIFQDQDIDITIDQELDLDQHFDFELLNPKQLLWLWLFALRIMNFYSNAKT